MAKRKNRSRTTLERCQVKIALLLAELALRPKTKPEIADFLGLSLEQVAHYVRILHADGKMYIRRWSRAQVSGLSARWRPVWVAGAGKDAKKPPPPTRQQLSRAQYAKRKRDPDLYEQYLRDARRRMSLRNFKPRMDVAAAWIVAKPPTEPCTESNHVD